MLSATLSFVLLAALPQIPLPEPEPRHLVHVFIRDAYALARLQALDLDLAGCSTSEPSSRVIDVIARDADLVTLSRSGLPFDVAIRNLQQHHAAEAARHGAAVAPLTLTPPLGQGAMGGHWTLAQVEAILDSFAQDYPLICAPKVSIGRSVEGRDIWMVKISDNPNINEDEPEVLFDSLHHAREPLSMEATVLFMDRLLTGYGTDPELTWLVNERELFFIPVLNPDGYEWNRLNNPNGGGMWRKNRRSNPGGSFGVDLNRNYSTGWSAPNGGNSTSPTSETYRGPAPFSEPETAALEAFCNGRQFVQVFSTHTYTDVLLRPWGYQNGNPTNASEYDLIGDMATARNQIQHGNTAQLLYIAAGAALDHHHVVRGAFGWTAELGRQNEGGFWPAGSNILAIAERHQHMFDMIAMTSGPVTRIGTVAITEVPPGNGNGRVDPGETGRVLFTLHNDGASNFTTDVTATLTALSPGITIGNGTLNLGRPARFSQTPSAVGLTFTVPLGFTDPLARLRLTVNGGGRTIVEDLRIVYGELRRLVDDDMEQDRGFARVLPGTATRGRWERSVPQQTMNGSTVFQPGFDHTPNGTYCYVTDGRAGSSVGAYDVDDGATELLSPTLDLAHLQLAKVSFWYWYAESLNNDAFVVEATNDNGGQWVQLLSTFASTNAWVQFTAELPFTPTSQVRLRFRAQDWQASLVEALVDDVLIEGLTVDGAVTLLSSGVRGTMARLGITGRANAAIQLFAAGGTADLALPGVTGNLLLDPLSLTPVVSAVMPAEGYLGFDMPIPGSPMLLGATIHFQAAHFDGTTLRLGNRQTLTVR